MDKNDKNKEPQLPLTQSRYVLAKYGIQVIDQQVDPLRTTFIPEGAPIDEEHYHTGPRAIECKSDLGKFSCDRDSCMKILWYYLFPCLLVESCFLYCCDFCCECLSTCLKRMEENYTLECCGAMSCCRLEEH